MNYSIMIKPNNNIAYTEQYHKICCLELGVLLKSKGYAQHNIRVVRWNKAYLVSFELDKSLGEDGYIGIYNLSFYYMLFQNFEGGMLKPIVIDHQPDFEDDLSVRLKYNGKTNEQITRMMMMTARHLSDYNHLKVMNVFDPMCGRGTTLFEAMISGYDAYGVERDKKSFMEMTAYITRYIKEARFKHTNQRGKVIANKENIGESYELNYAKDKSQYKSGQLNTLKVMRGNTTNIEGAFRHNLMHVIVVDLPYNIQHRGKSDGDNSTGLSGLLAQGLKEWDKYLKKGGVLAVSWNVYTDKREVMVGVLENEGYHVYNEKEFTAIEHRVAQAITRDIIFAKKV